MKTLVLGGIRSGKSEMAEQMAKDSKRQVIYIATANPVDEEMERRIKSHRDRRPAGWNNLEQPIHLAQTLQSHADQQICLLVDCLSVWITNLLISEDSELLNAEVNALINFLPGCPGDIIFVSSESNMGVVPLGELSRQYCDVIGLLHQDIAALSDRVILSIAGLPQVLKGEID
jgi:adenosylcobinamide kinase/adenosylcobinamide-phosphate guanylyltransferase